MPNIPGPVDDILDTLLGVTRGSPPKAWHPKCSDCEANGMNIRMEPDAKWDPSQCLYMSVWSCPECGRTVYRAAEDGAPTDYDGPGESSAWKGLR